jgi:hypothetical protein
MYESGLPGLSCKHVAQSRVTGKGDTYTLLKATLHGVPLAGGLVGASATAHDAVIRDEVVRREVVVKRSCTWLSCTEGGSGIIRRSTG